jgi:hypothetical protein
MKVSEQIPLIKKKIMDYFEDYGSGDYEKTVSTHYSEDAIFESDRGRFVGREDLIKDFEASHAGGAIEEKLRPTNILIDGDSVAVELDAELFLTEDVPDFRYGPGKKGDSIVIKFGVFYEIRDGKIAHATLFRGNFSRTDQ